MEINVLFCLKGLKINLINIFFILNILNIGLGNINEYKSEIKLVIQGKENQYFINEFFYLNPSEVIVNGILKDSCKKSCTFENDLNYVTIKFDRRINSSKNMFYGLKNIIEIDLSTLDISKVTNMISMFEGCSNLQKINFGNINTSLVKDMAHLFHECKKLTSIDVSKFDTSSVTSFEYLFRYCESLTSINVSNFNTQNVVNMFDIFAYCYKLISINLSNFDTSKVTNMQGFFYKCYKLKFLDLRNFNTTLATNLTAIFQFDDSLIYINLFSFIKKNNAYIDLIFDDTSPNLIICINDITTQNLLKEKYPQKKLNCSDICFKYNIKIDLKTNKCIEYCIEGEYKYEYDNYCYDKCPNTTYISNNKKYLCLLKKPDNYYYFDINNKVYKECYNKCKNCNEEGDETNNNCIECKDGFIFLNDTNCYKICPYYYYFNEYNKYTCTEEKQCPFKYNKLIKEKNKCVDDCSKDDIYIFEYNHICYKYCPNNTNESNHICFENEVLKEDKIIQVLKEYIMNSDIIENILKGNDDYIQQEDDIIYQITTSDNQKNNSNKNISSINLGECENTLREKYDINETLPLIILKIDYKYPGVLIPLIGYEVYHPINKTKLDLSDCGEVKLSIPVSINESNLFVKLSIPVSINESNLFKHNPKSEFYTDDCSSFTTENGTDIILNDRQKEFSDNNLSLCENNCEYLGYDSNFKQSSCECVIKNKMDSIADIISNPNKLSNNFENEENNNKNLISSNIMKCTKTLFTKDGIINNISSYILFILITHFLLSIVLFMKCGYNLLKEDINNILEAKKIITKKIKIK